MDIKSLTPDNAYITPDFVNFETTESRRYKDGVYIYYNKIGDMATPNNIHIVDESQNSATSLTVNLSQLDKASNPFQEQGEKISRNFFELQVTVRSLVYCILDENEYVPSMCSYEHIDGCRTKTAVRLFFNGETGELIVNDEPTLSDTKYLYEAYVELLEGQKSLYISKVAYKEVRIGDMCPSNRFGTSFSYSEKDNFGFSDLKLLLKGLLKRTQSKVSVSKLYVS